MRIIRDTQFVASGERGGTAAIGNFDGVHLGHQAVIAQAAQWGRPVGVVTFEPHPRSFFAQQNNLALPPFRLMNATARANRLEKLGVDRLYELNFNTSLSSLPAYDFAANILHKALGLEHVVVGADFCFGKGRKGRVSDLKAFGAQLGFGVEIAEMVETDIGEVSSTNIRAALAAGKPRDAAAMLGHWHRIDGAVIQGDQRGRELGYPTANMSIDGLHPPRFGVYAVVVDVLTGPYAGSYGGAASIGVRPMFGENRPNCETFLFDFKGDLYGETLSVGLVDYLRGEETFEGLEALITQMDADCAQARTLLAAI